MIPLLSLLAILPAAAFAQTAGPLLDYSIGWRVEYQDNIAELPDEEIDDIISAPFIQVGLDRAGSALDASIFGFVEHVNYLDDTFSSDLRASMVSKFVWRISDERIHWVLSDSMAESSIDPRALRNPDNQQFTNSLSTGPDVILHLGAADRLTLGARYNDFYAEESNDDNDGWLLSAAWSRRLRQGTSYGLRAMTRAVEFSADSQNTDYDRHDLVFEFRRQRELDGARDDFAVDLGYSILEFDDPARDDNDEPAVRVSWERVLQTGRSFSLSLAHEISDIASDLSDVVEVQRASTIFPTAVTGDPFTRNGVRAAFSNSWQRLSFNASGFYDELDYDARNLDQNFGGLALGIDYLLRPLLSLESSIDWTSRQFTDVDQDDETLSALIGLRYQRTRHWSYSLFSFATDRSSSNAAFDADNAGVYLQVAYSR